MSDLLPCRFCRFTPHAWLDDYINGRAVTDPEYIIECENGNCSVMPEVRGTYPYMDEVRAMWNTANVLSAVQPTREMALREAASAAKSSCVKCGGDGWQWGYELDDPPGDEAPRPDDTRYSCDGGGCKASSVILNLIKK